MASAINEYGKFDPLVIEYDIVGVAATTGGAVGAFENPFDFDVIVTNAVFRSTVNSTGAANIDVGVAANGTTSNDTIFDGLAVGSAAKVAHSGVANGTNGTGAVFLGEDQYITITGSATTAGLVAKLYLFCRPV